MFVEHVPQAYFIAALVVAAAIAMTVYMAIDSRRVRARVKDVDWRPTSNRRTRGWLRSSKPMPFDNSDPTATYEAPPTDRLPDSVFEPAPEKRLEASHDGSWHGWQQRKPRQD